MGGVLGLGFQGFGDDLFDAGVVDAPRGAGAGIVGEAVEPVVEEALAPLADGGHRDAEIGGDLGVRLPFGGGEDDAGAEGEPLGSLRAADPGFEFLAFVVGEGERREFGPGELLAENDNAHCGRAQDDLNEFPTQDTSITPLTKAARV